jgi:hypothetical protein
VPNVEETGAAARQVVRDTTDRLHATLQELFDRAQAAVRAETGP